MNTNLPDLTPWFTPGGPAHIGDMSPEMFAGYIVGRRDAYAEGVRDGRAELESEQEAHLTAAAIASTQAAMHDLTWPEQAAARKANEKKQAAARDAWWTERRASRTEAA